MLELASYKHMKAFASVVNMSYMSISAGDSADVHMCAHFLPSKIIIIIIFFFWVVDIWLAIVGIVIQRANSPPGSTGHILYLLSSENHQECIEHCSGQGVLITCACLLPFIIKSLTVLYGMLMVKWIITNEAAHSF